MREDAHMTTPGMAWRFGVPVVCALAGVLLAATHGVSGGTDIRRSDSPRLVDLVREAQQSVDRLSAQRDASADKTAQYQFAPHDQPQVYNIVLSMRLRAISGLLSCR